MASTEARSSSRTPRFDCVTPSRIFSPDTLRQSLERRFLLAQGEMLLNSDQFTPEDVKRMSGVMFRLLGRDRQGGASPILDMDQRMLGQDEVEVKAKVSFGMNRPEDHLGSVVSLTQSSKPVDGSELSAFNGQESIVLLEQMPKQIRQKDDSSKSKVLLVTNGILMNAERDGYFSVLQGKPDESAPRIDVLSDPIGGMTSFSRSRVVESESLRPFFRQVLEAYKQPRLPRELTLFEMNLSR